MRSGGRKMRFKPFALTVYVVGFAYISAVSARDVTFFVAADLHYGQDQLKNNEEGNKKVIALMNGISGTKFPKAEFGTVQTPRGVLLAGDLTDSGTSVNYDGISLGMHAFDGFIDDYPVNNVSGVHIHFPVYECYGNHDVQKQTGDAVLKGMIERNKKRATQVNVSDNGLHYSWDWDDVHFINLNIYGGGEGDARNSLDFLKIDLTQRVGKSGRPVVILQHYGFDKLSIEDRWWKQPERDALYEVIKNYYIAAFFTGHEHRCHKVEWNGIPDFVAPKARGDEKTDGFFAVRMIDKKMIVAQRRLDDSWDKVWTEALKPPAQDKPKN
jgi:cytolysin (calcineurin-like family phosphatase)